MNYKTIREVAEMTGVTVNALRYYDEKNLVHPTTKKGTGRHEWLYDDDAIERIRLVVLYRQIEMPVSDIAKILANDPSAADIVAKKLRSLREKRSEIDEQIVLGEMIKLMLHMPGNEMKAMREYLIQEHGMIDKKEGE